MIADDFIGKFHVEVKLQSINIVLKQTFKRIRPTIANFNSAKHVNVTVQFRCIIIISSPSHITYIQTTGPSSDIYLQ